MLEIFIEFLDGVFYEGYANELQKTKPETFAFEYAQFLNNYN